MPGHGRVVLFLIGPSSSFWPELARAFEMKGARVVKVCFGLGDWVFWRRPGAYHYRGRLSRWQGYVERLMEREGVTDLIYYADRQPYHLIAGAVARARNIPAMTVENGYLRPDWITLELSGMGAHSHFPDDPERIRAIARDLPEPDMTIRYPHGFWNEMVKETSFHLLNYSWRILYPFYVSGKYYDTLLEMLFGLLSLLGRAGRRKHADAVVAECAKGDAPYFVSALQLQGDYQIRANSPYRHIAEMIEEVISSFAAHAHPDAKLVFKQHPHDNNRENWSRIVVGLASERGIGERVRFIDGGDLNALLAHARGCVIINSTVGLHALRFRCPVKVLGIAVYEMAGLTHQGTLDKFWRTPEPVDTDLLDAFNRALAGTIQVKGSLYNPEGRRVAIAEIVRRVLDRRVNEPGAMIDPPPRRARARSMGLVS
jgi:capsular polysaccharide export protein